MEYASCLLEDPDLFFPSPGETAKIVEAKRVCSTCPVKAQCRDFHQRHGDRWGVWAGEYVEAGREGK